MPDKRRALITGASQGVGHHNAITLSLVNELEGTPIKVNLVSPGFTSTNVNGFEDSQSLEEGSREVVRVALLGPDGPSTRWENATIPW